ncbi:hypothetical protein FRC03_012212 [Tulasnella sp. 419]|nr:hypothetical protein FRC02_001237 [Tulasnella sp. 418]KAG8952280.1 hypothetical protein FRC03_012212 [Tulasnella sp. 419]
MLVESETCDMIEDILSRDLIQEWKSRGVKQQELVVTLKSLQQLGHYLMHQSRAGDHRELVNRLYDLEVKLEGLIVEERDYASRFRSWFTQVGNSSSSAPLANSSITPLRRHSSVQALRTTPAYLSTPAAPERNIHIRVKSTPVRGVQQARTTFYMVTIDKLRKKMQACYRIMVMRDITPNWDLIEDTNMDFDDLIDGGLIPLRLLLLFIPFAQADRYYELEGFIRQHLNSTLLGTNLYGFRRHKRRWWDRPTIVWDTRVHWGVDGENSFKEILQILKDLDGTVKLPNTHCAGALLCIAHSAVGIKMDVQERATLIGSLYQWVVEIRRQDLDGSNPESLSALAIFIYSLYEKAVTHSSLKSAHNILDNGVKIRRMLEEQGQTAHLTELALSLKRLAEHLKRHGQSEASVEPRREAAEIYQALADVNRLVYLPGLASHTEGLAASLSHSRHGSDAVEAGERAVRMYRELVESDPRLYLQHLARSWKTLSQYLSNQERHEDAIKAGQKAVETHKTLVRDDPEGFRPALAESLHQLCCGLGNASQYQEAVKVAEELVDLYRELTKSNHKLHYPRLADSLDQLAMLLNKVERHDEAVKIEKEVIKIREELVKSGGDSYLAFLVTSRDSLVKYKQQKDMIPTFRRITDFARRTFGVNIVGTVLKYKRS